MNVTPIPGFDGYFASDSGIIWSARRGRLRRLQPFKIKGGYLVVGVREGGKKCKRGIHRLVLFAFVGPCPDGMECAHKNGDPADNRLDNLKWSTPFGNYLDKVKHGTVYRGERQHSAKLTAAKVVEIRQLLSTGMRHCEIAERFGVTCPTISNIAVGRTWRHVANAEHVSLRRYSSKYTR